jgi:hypothetical protein
MVIIAMLLSMLPNPRVRFDVHINPKTFVLPMWTSTTGPNRLIVSRMAEFWSTITGEQGSFASGSMVDNICCFSLRFSEGSSLWKQGASFGYCCDFKMFQSDPILAHVKTLKLVYGSEGLNQVSVLGDLDCLPNVEDIIIEWD